MVSRIHTSDEFAGGGGTAGPGSTLRTIGPSAGFEGNRRKYLEGFLRSSVVNNTPANAEASGSIPDEEDPLQKEIAAHSSILAWKIPWTEEPGGLYSMRSQRVRHDLATKQQNI